MAIAHARGTGPSQANEFAITHPGGHHAAYSCTHGRARVRRDAGTAGGRTIGRRSRKTIRHRARRRRCGQRPKTTIIKGEAKHWEPGQSYSPTGEAKFLGNSTYTQTVDNATRTVRIDWDRDMKYPAVERLKFSEITTPTFGVVIDDKGVQTPMSGIRLAAHLRERERASPRLLVRALEDPQSIAALPDQQIGERSLPAVSIKTRAGTFTVLFDRATQSAGGDPHPRRRQRVRRLRTMICSSPIGRTSAVAPSGRTRCHSSSTAWRCSG